MCKFFSCIVTKNKKVYYKKGVDSHDTVRNLYLKKDKDLIDDKDPPNNTFARVEIVPENGKYLQPDKWIFVVDEKVRPDWITKDHEKLAFTAFNKVKKEVYDFNVKETLKPVHPFMIVAPSKITKKHLDILKQWASVRDSVGDSVRDSVWDSVKASVWNSVWDSVVGGSVGDSVGDSVWNSVWDSVVGGSVWGSVWAYIGYLFPNIKKWKYVDYRKLPFKKIKGYPFQSGVKLWKLGLVPVFYDDTWKLYGSLKGNGKIQVLWEGKI